MLIVEAIGVAQVTPTFVAPALHLLELQMPREPKTCHT